MKKRSYGTILSATSLASTQSYSIDMEQSDSVAVQVVYSDANPAAVTFDSDTFEVQTLTFAAKAATTHQDLVIISNAAGLSFAVALTKPVAEVQTLTFPALAAITDADYIVVEDTAGVKYAVYADKTGATAAPTGAAYVAATHKVKADISGAGTAASVAAIFETAFNTLTGFTAAITTDDTAADGTMTLTQVIKAPATNPVPKNADDSGAGTLAGVQTTAGVASVAPSGALWTAVAGARKGLADISADTTAAQVAARVETALNALTGFTASITTDDTAANGTMTLTQIVAGPTTNAVPKNAAESGAGSITAAETTAGLISELDLTADTITIASHGLVTGTKVALTTAGTLPTGLSATDYYVIKVDANTIQFASSLANAVAGTDINITAEGSGVHTLTPAASTSNVAKLQESNDNTNWTDVASQTVTIATSAGSVVWEYTRSCRYLKVLYTPSAGQVSLAIHTSSKR